MSPFIEAQHIDQAQLQQSYIDKPNLKQAADVEDTDQKPKLNLTQLHTLTKAIETTLDSQDQSVAVDSQNRGVQQLQDILATHFNGNLSALIRHCQSEIDLEEQKYKDYAKKQAAAASRALANFLTDPDIAQSGEWATDPIQTQVFDDLNDSDNYWRQEARHGLSPLRQRLNTIADRVVALVGGNDGQKDFYATINTDHEGSSKLILHLLVASKATRGFTAATQLLNVAAPHVLTVAEAFPDNPELIAHYQGDAIGDPLPAGSERLEGQNSTLTLNDFPLTPPIEANLTQAVQNEAEIVGGDERADGSFSVAFPIIRNEDGELAIYGINFGDPEQLSAEFFDAYSLILNQIQNAVYPPGGGDTPAYESGADIIFSVSPQEHKAAVVVRFNQAVHMFGVEFPAGTVGIFDHEAFQENSTDPNAYFDYISPTYEGTAIITDRVDEVLRARLLATGVPENELPPLGSFIVYEAFPSDHPSFANQIVTLLIKDGVRQWRPHPDLEPTLDTPIPPESRVQMNSIGPEATPGPQYRLVFSRAPGEGESPAVAAGLFPAVQVIPPGPESRTGTIIIGEDIYEVQKLFVSGTNFGEREGFNHNTPGIFTFERQEINQIKDGVLGYVVGFGYASVEAPHPISEEIMTIPTYQITLAVPDASGTVHYVTVHKFAAKPISVARGASTTLTNVAEINGTLERGDTIFIGLFREEAFTQQQILDYYGTCGVDCDQYLAFWNRFRGLNQGYVEMFDSGTLPEVVEIAQIGRLQLD